MSGDVFKLGVVKFGAIGAAPLLDLIFDERADRKDLEVRVFTSGAKLDEDSCVDATKMVIDYKPQLILSVSTNAALKGPTKSREMLHEAGIPTLTISDGPSEKGFYKKGEDKKKVKTVLDKQGFFILYADSMIGARREFLDPTEMVLFNADIIKVLTNTGVIRLLQEEIHAVIDALKAGNEPKMPTVKVTAEKAVAAAGFGNPYAGAKAFAALKIAEGVADVTTKGCFVEQDPVKYVPMVAAGHEMMRAAAMLSDEARELEKSTDTLLRTPHTPKGKIKKKKAFAGKLE